MRLFGTYCDFICLTPFVDYGADIENVVEKWVVFNC